MRFCRAAQFVTLTIGLLLTLLSRPVVAEDLRLASIFSQHAVLQQGVPAVVWGWSRADDTIRVRLGGRESVTTADAAGQWRVTFAPWDASLEPITLEVLSEATSQRLLVEDLFIGEVWHASGQSNMEMTVASMLQRLPELADEIQESDHHTIRYCRLDAPGTALPQSELPPAVTWRVGSPETVRSFSAVAYYFAKRLQQSLNVPIGILDSSRGGTPIEPFIPREAYRGHPTLERELELGDAQDLTGIKQLAGGVWARDENWLPGRLFHSRIAPVTSFAVRGVIWYQGESNCGDGEDPRYYQHKMRALVLGWRAALHDDRLPFYYVQLPGSGARERWPYLREQQRLAMDLPNTGMAVTIDLLDDDIHPPNKRDVGERLARWALRNDYHLRTAVSGPLFRDVRFAEGKAIVAFDHVERGLMVARKNGLGPVQEIRGISRIVSIRDIGRIRDVPLFELADEQGNWRPAEAEVVGETVVVTNEAITRPLAVRYAYEVSPKNVRLYNRDGLPASPFCSSPQLLQGW